jgi:predicted exporter
MKGNLYLTPLKLQHVSDKEERSRLARQEYSRLQAELEAIEGLMQDMFDRHIAELNKSEQDARMIEQMEA